MSLNITASAVVNEGTTPKITATLKDENGSLVPDDSIDSITIAIHDYNTGTELREAEVLIPSDSVVTTWLSLEETRIIDSALEYEHRVVTITAQYLTSRYVSREINIKILNLRHYSVAVV
jgi:hypothetical protein